MLLLLVTGGGYSRDPSTAGKSRINPALILGRQAHTTARVVSIVVQKVTGILSQVGSAVRPNHLRVERRIIEAIQTLRGYVLETPLDSIVEYD